MLAVAEVTWRETLLFLHIASVLIGFGITFAYPILFRFGMRNPAGLAWFHRAQGPLGLLITISMVFILGTGMWLVEEAGYSLGDPWITVGFTVIIVIGALGGMFFAPKERRLAELAERDAGTPSAEYLELWRTVRMVSYLSAFLVLVALFFMVTKVGA